MVTEGSSGTICDTLVVDLGSEQIPGWGPPLRENVVKHSVMKFSLMVDCKVSAEGV